MLLMWQESLSKHWSSDAKIGSWQFSCIILSLDFVYAFTSLRHCFHHGYWCIFIICDRQRLCLLCFFFIVIPPDRCPRLHAQSEQNDTFFFLWFPICRLKCVFSGGCSICAVFILLMISCAAPWIFPHHDVYFIMTLIRPDVFNNVWKQWSNVSAEPNAYGISIWNWSCMRNQIINWRQSLNFNNGY